MAQSRECTVGAAAQTGQLDDKFLMKLSEQLGETLGSQHMQLGVYLRLDPSAVQKLRADSKAPLETTFLLLKTWRDSRGKGEDSGAMFDELCRALSDLKRPDLTDDVRREQIKLLKEELRGAKGEVESCRQKYDDQMKLVKEELRGAKGEVESCRQKYDEVHPQFLNWSTIISLELLLMKLYVEKLGKLASWFFATDHTHYSSLLFDVEYADDTDLISSSRSFLDEIERITSASSAEWSVMYRTESIF
ncbi:hypothetical protein LSAT2_010642, partial [Lamellibrachia satsuma]